MFGAAFSFRGRLNRLQYFGGCMGLGSSLLVVAVVLVGLAAASGGGQEASLLKAGIVGLLLVVILFPVYLWTSFALQARRFRDIGWEPVFVIPAWIGFQFLDKLLVMGAPQIAVSPMPFSGSWLGVIVNLGLGLSLLFWPGKPDFDIASVFDDEPAPPRPSPAWSPPAPAPASAPARMAAPARPMTSTPSGFGRRGV